MVSISKKNQELKKESKSIMGVIFDYKISRFRIGKQVENGPINFYLDHFNSGSKPQLLSDTNCKSCTWKQNKAFCHLLENYIYKIVLFASATLAREITEPLRKMKIRIYDL